MAAATDCGGSAWNSQIDYQFALNQAVSTFDTLQQHYSAGRVSTAVLRS